MMLENIRRGRGGGTATVAMRICPALYVQGFDTARIMSLEPAVVLVSHAMHVGAHIRIIILCEYLTPRVLLCMSALMPYTRGWEVGGWNSEVGAGGWRLKPLRLELMSLKFEALRLEVEAGGWRLELRGWRLKLCTWG